MITIEKIQHRVSGQSDLGCLLTQYNRESHRIDTNKRMESLNQRLLLASQSINQLEKERVSSFKSKFFRFYFR